MKRRISPRTASRLRGALAAVDRLTLPIARRRLRESRPLPPRELRVRIGAVDPARFLEGGARSAQAVFDCFVAANVHLGEVERVLDFGCGCGRAARHLLPRVPEGAYHGCDVDAPAIAWLQRRFPEGRFAVNGFAPPLPYPDRHFEALFSLSILTHLDRGSQLAWLHELRRVLRPGGTALISIHGPAAAERSWWGQGLTAEAAEEINRRGPRLEEEGFFFVPFGDLETSAEKYAGITGAYGNSFQSHAWTVDTWSEALAIERIVPRSVAGYQDIVVARAP